MAAVEDPVSGQFGFQKLYFLFDHGGDAMLGEVNLADIDPKCGSDFPYGPFFHHVTVIDDGFAGDSGNIVLSWTLESTTDQVPRILVQPESRSVASDSSLILSNLAVGQPPLTYQWFHNCESIPGATNDSLLLTNLRNWIPVHTNNGSGPFEYRDTNAVNDRRRYYRAVLK